MGTLVEFTARRVRFGNGERFSIVHRPGGLPVHEAALYLARFRRRGRAANTIHAVATAVALLYRCLAAAKIDLHQRLSEGNFLLESEVSGLADAAQYWAADIEEDSTKAVRSTVISLRSVRRRQHRSAKERRAVGAEHQSTRIRYMAGFLGFLADYYGSQLPAAKKAALALESTRVLKSFVSQAPRVSRRAKVGAREGLSQEDQDKLVAVVDPGSSSNPWARDFVRRRNWIVVVLLLATGMRRGELLGLQIGDFDPQRRQVKVLRRADAAEDPRPIQANTKTNDRVLELRPEIMDAVWTYIQRDRRAIKAARKHPLLIVADDGKPLSFSAVGKLFAELRVACPGLPVRLTSHVMRHTWNERFSEQADLMNLSEVAEMRARNEQQGWADDSQSAATYTRRHISAKSRQIALKLQEKLNVPEE